jgi:hypothetical protein
MPDDGRSVLPADEAVVPAGALPCGHGEDASPKTLRNSSPATLRSLSRPFPSATCFGRLLVWAHRSAVSVPLV